WQAAIAPVVRWARGRMAGRARGGRTPRPRPGGVRRKAARTPLRDRRPKGIFHGSHVRLTGGAVAEKGLFELFPEAFVARSRALLGAEADRFLEALASPPQGLRVNTLRLTVERFLELSPFELVPLP